MLLHILPVSRVRLKTSDLCREADRLRRIKEEGFDRFAPLSDNNPRWGCAGCAIRPLPCTLCAHSQKACVSFCVFRWMKSMGALRRPDLVPKGYPGAEGVKD